MSVPSRTAQIEGIAEFLDKSVDEERTAKDVATIIVDTIYDMWAVDFNVAPQPPKVGMAFKTPAVATKIYYVAWIGPRLEGEDDQVCWVVDGAADYGMFVGLDSQFWRIVTESKDGRKDKSKPRPGSPGNNPDWSVNDKVSLMQRSDTFRILATGDRSVLLRSVRTGSLQAESNANLKKYYNKERV